MCTLLSGQPETGVYVVSIKHSLLQKFLTPVFQTNGMAGFQDHWYLPEMGFWLGRGLVLKIRPQEVEPLFAP